MIKYAFFRTNFLSGNSASKSLEIKQKQRVSKTNEALELESNKGFFFGNCKRIIDVKITYFISRSDLLKEKKNYFHRKI